MWNFYLEMTRFFFALGATFVVFGVYGILRAHEIVQKQTTIDGDVGREKKVSFLQ